MGTRTINWPATVSQMQALLNGPPTLSLSVLNEGASLRNTLSAAGATYDSTSTDGINNTGSYAQQIQAWAPTAQAAWIEVDRICRAIYKLTPSPSTYMLGAFGLPGVPTWTPRTAYSGFSAIVPATSTGYNYLQTSVGTTGGTQPTFPTTLGVTVSDGSITWICDALITGTAGAQPTALPWDLTLQTAVTLAARASAASVAAATSPGLTTLLNAASATYSAAIAARPAANPTLDAASVAATNTLNADLVNCQAWITVATFT